MLTARQRIENLLGGGKIDRPGVALWRHFPVDDQQPDQLAAAISNFQNTFQFDLIKITPASSFCLVDWGARDTWRGNPEGTRDYDLPAISDPESFSKIKTLSPLAGNLGKHLECIRLIQKEFGQTTPIIQTIFSPLAQAKNLLGKTNLVPYLRKSPDLILQGLETIKTTTLAYIHECKNNGIDGIFFAVQHAQEEVMTAQEYVKFGKPFDLEVLTEASNLPVNILHLHGDNIRFDLVKDLPASIVNWHDRHSTVNLSQGRKYFNKVVCGGLQQWQTLAYGDPESVETEAKDAIDQIKDGHFILGTGCVLPIITPFGNIMAMRKAAEGAVF
jgi:uroporphyrinogen decarboxylase